tara:strand:+ start:18858 stop:19241 length:384 start_codon:yes stop_codon:yes gene_type:complete
MYTKTEIINRLKRGETFYMLNPTKSEFRHISGIKIEYAKHGRMEGELTSIYAIRNSEIQYMLDLRGDQMNIDKITNKQMILYTTNMFGDSETTKINLDRIVFVTDAEYVQNKIDEEKRQFDELLKTI